MASRTITTLTDDIDGGDADETVTFSFKGTQYEIDLSKKNANAPPKPCAAYLRMHGPTPVRSSASPQSASPT